MANITVSKKVKEYLTNPEFGLTERIQLAMTPQKAEIFKTSLLNTVNSTALWEKVNPLSIGYKGLIQLAQRTGQYQTISASEVREGQIKDYDPLKGVQFDWTVTDGEIIGYVAYFKLINGFEKYLYMTLKELEAHGQKYSKSYNSKDKYTKEYNGIWKTNFDAMAKKTVLKQLISKFGIMSVEMQDAVVKDQQIIDKEGNGEYADNNNIVIKPEQDDRSEVLKFIQDEVETIESLEQVVNECKTDEEREAYDKKYEELQAELIKEEV